MYPPAGAPASTAGPARSYHAARVTDLLDAGLLAPDAILINTSDDVEATVLADGQIQFDGTVYESPSGAGDAAHGGSTNGWSYWYADTAGGLRTLAALRDDLLSPEGAGG